MKRAWGFESVRRFVRAGLPWLIKSRYWRGKGATGDSFLNMLTLTEGLLVCTCSSTFIFLIYSCVLRMRKTRLVPGPEGYLCCGNSFQIQADHIHKNLKEYHEIYGKIVRLKIFGTTIISISSLDLLKSAFEYNPSCEIANDRSANSTSGVFYGRKHIGMADLHSITLLLRDFHRSVAPNISETGGNLDFRFRTEIHNLYLELGSKNRSDTNPHDYLRSFHKNLCSILLIGETLPRGDPDHDVLWEFIDHLYALIDPAVDVALRTFPFLRLLPGYYGNLYRQTIAARDRVAKRFFEDQKASYRPGVVRGLVDVCLINQQAEISRTGTSWLTDEHIKGLIYDTLAAGMTELLKSLRLFLLLMCHHPEVQARIQKEVDTVIGSQRFPEAGDRVWMPYIEAVLLEVWRYGSQTPLAIPHLCRKDVVLEGYLIEAGTVIFPNLYAVHHDEAVWGDPWNFRPERFLDANGNLLPAEHVFMQNVIPFSVGKRACPGQDFARSRIFITVAALIQRMRIEPPEDSELPSPDPRLYTKNYPMNEPQFQCRFLARGDVFV
ncbi:cytochrome P450 2D27-like isoform X2 [Mya arenaria]|uniref:cytochrome P450 2D27-like isoform X2 n=1 Tax=Mya arenaria TaxID=6604 RepID=UPI0022E31E19|nr:cytochrome P450 2D27-like isoform X2 [Mya arenaria]